MLDWDLDLIIPIIGILSVLILAGVLWSMDRYDKYMLYKIDKECSKDEKCMCTSCRSKK